MYLLQELEYQMPIPQEAGGWFLTSPQESLLGLSGFLCCYFYPPGDFLSGVMAEPSSPNQ